ncbi:MAG: vWA domain-containing protein [Bacteroidota bacterium]
MPHVELLLSTSGLFLFLAAAVAIILSILAYHRTVPPISQGTRYLLISLRALALFFLLLLILEPILRLVRKESKPPTVAVLVDDSKSMSLTDRMGDRSEIARALLKSDGIQKLSKLGRLLFFRFSSEVGAIPIPDFVRFNGDATDISRALEEIQKKSEEENIESIILVTDGNHNLGENPLREVDHFGMPVYTVGIGDSSEQKDVLITRVVTNEIAYAESRIPMDVRVKSSGFNGERVEVSLLEEGKTIAQQFLMLKEGTWEYPVKFFFEPKGEGTKRYTVNVSRLEGELTTANNVRSVFVKVLKSRMKVLLIAGAPSPDVAFIRRALSDDKNVDLKALVQKSAMEFYEGDFSPSVVTDADCIVLVGFPLSNSRDEILRAVQSGIQQQGKPLLIALSRNIDAAKLHILDSSLPFTVSPGSSGEISVSVQVPEKERIHPLMNLNGSPNLWDGQPPIYMTGTTFRAKPEAEILALAKVQGISLNEPLLLSRSVAGEKSVAILGYGIWRWKLLTQTSDPSKDVLQLFMSSAIRWLTTREESKPVKISSTKEVFAGGEPVEFSAQVYDKTYRPIDAADVKIAVTKGNETLETILTPMGNGRYEGRLEGLGEGEYQLSGTATLNGGRLGEDKGKFSVGAQEIESQQTQMNKPLLEQLAYRSGGKYFDPQDIARLPEELERNTKLIPKEITRASEFELWSLPTILILIILFFGVEWFLRKQAGLL